METMTRHPSTASRKNHISPRSGGTERPCQVKGAGHCNSQPTAELQYALATGEAATYRLHVLHNVYGPGTRRLLRDAGLRRGMRVADLGCGVGMVTALLAEIVGPEGEVVGVDYSGAQLAQARAHTVGTAKNIKFVEASAADTGLPRESFDLVYSRFLLIHLPDPEAALREMLALLKPNGILVCEDGDLTTADSQPKSALQAFSGLWAGLGPKRGVDYTLGRRLYQMVLTAGFTAPEIVINQPVVARGENKRLLELSVAEAGPAFVAAGLITSDELESTLADMRRANEDASILAFMPRMSQVWARKPARRDIWRRE
jgi:SAM-dependent methyltransferase